MPRVWLVHLDPPLMLPDGRDRWPTGIRNSTTVSAAFVLSDTQTIGDRVEDAQVGLVRHDERDILKAHAGPLEHSSSTKPFAQTLRSDTHGREHSQPLRDSWSNSDSGRFALPDRSDTDPRGSTDAKSRR